MYNMLWGPSQTRARTLAYAKMAVSMPTWVGAAYNTSSEKVTWTGLDCARKRFMLFARRLWYFLYLSG